MVRGYVDWRGILVTVLALLLDDYAESIRSIRVSNKISSILFEYSHFASFTFALALAFLDQSW